MKVLFAVNSESVSEAIIKKYQKDYREILSYKNVYYFNAILKEIQRDKSYDRIIISEDLEPFSNSNYESIDKFVFEKLDGISDEAHDVQGNEISIILICSDRHTKGNSFLVKLFGLGIYSALLGNDRSMEEVCRLINKPRTKKEAKMYYKIDTDDVNYRAENENEVSELEIKNILTHFKKLGKSTEKYASSFENIANQYTNEQLKIIINCLPISVKAILEETSSRYQEIMSVNGGIVKGIRSSGTAVKEDQKRTGIKIDIIENKLNQTKMTKPIVIPSSVKTTNAVTAKKVVPVKKTAVASQVHQTQPVSKLNKMQNQNIDDLNRLKTVKPVRKVVQQVSQTKSENVFDDLDDIELPEIESRKNIVTPQVKNTVVETEKKRRGRPRKTVLEEVIEDKPKGKRGRPKKVVELEEIEENLPDLETITDTEFDFSNELDDLEEINTTSELLNFEGNDELQLDNNEEISYEVDLPELDDLDDMDAYESEDILLGDIEESFDEFEDYDEYGEYQTQAKFKKEKAIDDLYNEDILQIDDSQKETEEIEIPGFDELDDLDDLEYETEISDENSELISGFDEDILAIDDEEQELIADFDDDLEDESLNFEDNSQTLYQDEFSDDLYVSNNETVRDTYEGPERPKYNNNLETIKSSIDYSMSNLNSLMTKDKKIVTFLGSTKNGVSFLVNNLAEIFASVGIDTAILDMTKNKNSYYIYTQNEENLRKIAYASLEKLQEGIADGIRVKQNLTVYTALPNDGKDYSNAEPILSTLVQNHSLVLVDCDFDTNPSYFASSQEIYLVQSMDILTIQPLTAFLRDLKTQGVLEPEKVRVVINKELKVRGLTNKAIIGGMSFYNDPSMSFMTELFDKDNVKYCSIPFEEMTYSRYLEAMLNCKISLNGYSKNFINRLKILGDMVYPLTSRQTYSTNSKQSYGTQPGFSNSMNTTLNKMRKKY